MERSRKKGPQRNYPRTVRVNALLHEVLAEALERLSDHDERLLLTTITGVSCDPDLRHALVFLSSLDDERSVALEDHRRALQSEVAAQVRLKRIPSLKFLVDPAIVAGNRVEEALRRVQELSKEGPDS
ncbi:MAG TPA: ribosome-binding factor A [Acidimicrobiales bacterium]|nr:ribosome-binding factor A [Acidimicrobiales bacterium]